MAGDPAIARAPYQQTYDQATDFDAGYHYREPAMAPSVPAGPRRSKLEFLSSKWPRLFFITIAVQAVICLAFEA